MYHFFVTTDQVREDGIHITGADVNHIRNVLRMKEGEQVAVSDGNNLSYTCSVDAFLPDEVILSVQAVHEAENELPAEITLFQGIPKGDKFETIVQKAVELGAARIVPVAMKRCVAKIEPKKEASRIQRYQKIAEAAAKQAGRNRIPEVTGVMTLSQAIAYAEGFEQILLPYELADDMQNTRDILASVRPGQRVGIFIGPEGGFDQAEVSMLSERGAKTITLGKRILRTETAGMTILSVLMFQLS